MFEIMNEQKYLVMKKSNSKFLCKTIKDRLKWKKDGYYSNSCPEFTELELEKIKGGRLYKKEVYEGETKVWIKPSIEIISLEEYGIL